MYVSRLAIISADQSHCLTEWLCLLLILGAQRCKQSSCLHVNPSHSWSSRVYGAPWSQQGSLGASQSLLKRLFRPQGSSEGLRHFRKGLPCKAPRSPGTFGKAWRIVQRPANGRVELKRASRRTPSAQNWWENQQRFAREGLITTHLTSKQHRLLNT